MQKWIGALLVFCAASANARTAAPYDDTWAADVYMPVGCTTASFPVVGTITMVIRDGVITGQNDIGSANLAWHSHVGQDGAFKAGTLTGTFTGAGFDGAFVSKVGNCTIPLHFTHLVPGPYDGNWTGDASNHIADMRCSGIISAKIEHGRLAGTANIHMSIMSVSGVVLSDGSFNGRFAPWGYPLTGKFDGSSFKGHANFRTGGGQLCGGFYDVVLERQP